MATSYHPEYDQSPSPHNTNNSTGHPQHLNNSNNNNNNNKYYPNNVSSLSSTISGSTATKNSSQSHSYPQSLSSLSSSSSPHINNNNNNINNSKTISSSPQYHHRTTHRLSSYSYKPISSRLSHVDHIISITPQCYLKPKCFFVAWNAVITLVFNGWPEPIDTMKNELESKCTVCKEMFGSKFPKITLACVKDGIEMTPSLLFKIRRLCKMNKAPKDYVLCLDNLSVVLYENRSQENIIYEKIIPLKKNHKFLGSPRPLLLNLEEDQDDAPFLRSANRTSHYRSLVIGSSIVYRLNHVPKFITDFQAKLPNDIFDTFSKESMCVTVRALC